MANPREVLYALIDLDADMCSILADPEGRSEAIKKLREYEKVIIHILGLEDELAALIAVDPEHLRTVCKLAYDVWKVEK